MVGAPAVTWISRAVTGVIGIVGLVYAGGAFGADWNITPRINVSESFSDNANLDANDEDPNSDFLTRVAPGISIVGQGGRGSLNLSYDLSQTFSHLGAQDTETNNNLAATGQIEVWKRIAFIDANASISQAISDTRGASSNSVAGENVNRTETRAASVSPYFLHHFGTWVETETRFTASGVTTENNEVEDAITVSEQLRINSGRRFAQFTWGIDVINSKSQYSGDEPAQRQRRVDGSGTVIVNSKISLLGGVGWEDIEDSDLDSQPSGLTWNAGIALRPSPRTSARLTYGKRNGENSFDFEGSHQLSSRTAISASYNESIETSQQQVANLVNDFLRTPQGQIILLNGQPTPVTILDPTNPFGLEEDTFRQRSFSLNLTGSRRRNTFSAGLFWKEREFEFTDRVETAYGGNFSLTRQMSRRLDGFLNFAYTHTDNGDTIERSEDDISGSTGLSYQVRNDIRANLTYNLTFRKVNNAPDDLMENSVTLGLTKTF
jgi:uncharacterized protein (PEP-CTERM system associated)